VLLYRIWPKVIDTMVLVKPATVVEWMPDQAARQLPDQSTTLRVAPSSTGDPRLRGARQKIETAERTAGIASLPNRLS
jgi:hypothetical protein